MTNESPKSKKKTKTRYPIESFGPELMAALVAGGQRRVEIPFENKKMAVRFQMRIHMLRNRLREADHPNWKIAARARTSLRWRDMVKPEWAGDKEGNKGAVLVIYPHDSDFTDALAKAGITREKILEHDPLAGLAQRPDSAEGGAEAPSSSGLDSDPLAVFDRPDSELGGGEVEK